MKNLLFALLWTGAVYAQLAPAPVAAIGPDAARCDDLGASTICFQQLAGTTAVNFPEVAVVLGGQQQGPVVVSATAVSPSGRPWLAIAAPSQPPSPTVTGALPFDFRAAVDTSVTRAFGEGTYLSYINVFVGTLLRTRIPVVLRILPGNDRLAALPDRIDDLTAPAQSSPVTRPLIIEHLEGGARGAPSVISATPATNDGGGWLLVNLRATDPSATNPSATERPCALFPTPCVIDVILAPPPVSGNYIGAVTVSDGTRSTVIPVRARITTSTVTPPIDTPPGAIVLSAPIGSREKITRSLTVGNNSAGAPFVLVKEAEWLEVTPSGPFLPANFVLSVDPTGLEPGSYTDTIVLIHAETGSLLALIPVTLNITSPNYLPWLRQGGGWQSSLYLLNHGAEEVSVGLRFWSSSPAADRPRADPAEPWSLTVKDRGPLFAIGDERIPPGGVRVLETANNDRQMSQGWAEVLAGGPVATFVVMRRTAGAGGKLPPSEAAVPVARAFQSAILAPFDNTGDAVTTLTVANAADAEVRLRVTIRNQDGAESGRAADLRLPALGQAVLTLGDKDGLFPDTAGRIGSIEMAATGARLLAYAMRSRNGQLAPFPIAPKAGLANERGVPLIRFGGGWESALTIVNPSSLNQTGGLRFHAASGEPLATPFADSEIRRDAVSPVVPARGTVELQMPGKDAARTDGWVEDIYPAATQGFAVLRQENGGAAGLLIPYETTVPATGAFSGAVAMPFDNTGGRSTELALVNLDEQSTEIQVFVSDRSGRFSPREVGTFRLTPRGHTVVRVEDFEPAWAGRTGMVEFRSRSGNRLSGSALVVAGDSMVAIPAGPAR
ncbi:MAG: hypothetical protein R2762_28340 [Bryobacteraceae bacterium]